MALAPMDLRIERGRTTALIGSSGSGKSTVLKLLMGLIWPDRGQVCMEGSPLTRRALTAQRRRIGYVIQEGGLFPHLTIAQNLSLQARSVGWAATRIQARVTSLLDLVRLQADVLRRYPAELSGGQRQRVALARALMLDPPALLLDEPLGALDPVVRHDLQDELARIFAELKTTVVLVTHDMAEAAFLASRLVLLEGGRVRQDGSFADLRDRPADAFVSRFVASGRGLPQADA
ncbi:ATP-binding cassette domain-containing protein [Oleiagrimonas sp. C23AA]|uniref:ATP-binding cassette domain-containing protein n=1 Tax=Oleiagrimonas sp. C23AA TaxID=2719047 RepID=UPI001F115967|nr:ATP-binding cassette domain-containing protein [Oleiagrimonas sp. C23AA]